MFKFSYDSDSIDEIKGYCNNLEEEVSDITSRIYDLKEEIESGSKDIEELTTKIDLIKKRMEKDIEELSQLKNKLQQKEKQLGKYREIIQEEDNRVMFARIEAFQNYVLNMKLKDALSYKLRNNTSTVDLLDEFCASKKEFLILNDQFSVYNNSGYVSLIITHRYREIPVENTQPTMTELKQNVGKGVRYISCDRLQPLLKEIDKVDRDYKNVPKGSKFAFERPFLLGGQTSDNRTGYGCEWIGGGDYIEGTLYGEVTDFMVVGIIFEGYSWH